MTSPPPESCPISSPQELFLIRHAATDMTGTVCGQSDPPLNETGRAQASAVALLLRSRNVRRIYASDLQRAVQTAQPLAELWDVPIAARTFFREISFGKWEGRRWSQIRAEEPDITAMELSPGFCAPGGESFACFRDRVLQGLKQTVVDCGGHSAAIVTHLGVMRVVLKKLNLANGVWDAQHRMEHCSVYRIRVTGTILELAEEMNWQ